MLRTALEGKNMPLDPRLASVAMKVAVRDNPAITVSETLLQRFTNLDIAL